MPFVENVTYLIRYLFAPLLIQYYMEWNGMECLSILNHNTNHILHIFVLVLVVVVEKLHDYNCNIHVSLTKCLSHYVQRKQIDNNIYNTNNNNNNSQ